MDILNRLKSITEVSTNSEDLNKFSRDASIFKVRPKYIVRPKSEKEVEDLVSFVAQEKTNDASLSITPRAAGTCMSGGSLNDSIILDSSNLKLMEINGSCALIGPGLYFRDFEKEARKKNLIYPPYPASKDLCAFGGIIANNSGGEKSLTYGKTQDYVEEIWAVLSDGREYHFRNLSDEELNSKKSQSDFEGEIYRQVDDLLNKNIDLINSAKPRVSKNSSGYHIWNVRKNGFNLAQLLVGAQGTLGVMTKAKVRLVKPHSASSLLVVFMPSLEKLGEIVSRISEFKPESFESYDDKTLKLALRFFPKIIRKMKGNAIKLMISFIPELGMLIKGGLPKMVLVIEFAGDSKDEVMKKAKEALDAVEKDFDCSARIARSESEANKYWTIRRESFSLLRSSLGGLKTAPFIDDIVVDPKYLPEFIPRLNGILSEYKESMVYTIAGHAGDGNFHIIPLMDFKRKETGDIIFEISTRVYDLVFEYGGSMSGEHNDGIIRTPYLEKMFGAEMVKIFQEIKNIFDPQNIFNPGKKVNGTIADAKKYIIND